MSRMWCFSTVCPRTRIFLQLELQFRPPHYALFLYASGEEAAVSDQDLESGQGGAPRKARKHEPITLTPCQVVRWRWMRRVLSFCLFEPFIIDPFLKGTWLLNAWLRLMGADVSMGALILGRVADYGMVKVIFFAFLRGLYTTKGLSLGGGVLLSRVIHILDFYPDWRRLAKE